MKKQLKFMNGQMKINPSICHYVLSSAAYRLEIIEAENPIITTWQELKTLL